MTPPADGYWQWQDGVSLQFVPGKKDSIKADTVYHVDIDGLFLPSSIKMDKRQAELRSWPLAAMLQGLDFLTDPSPKAGHRLSLSLKFNYPAPKDFKLPSISATGTIFGNAEAVWNDDRTILNMAWPVKKLPDKSRLAEIRCDKLSQIVEKDGLFHLVRPKDDNSGTFFIHPVPGQRELFTIKNVELAPALNENLDQTYELNIESSLYASPEKLLENLHLLQLPLKNSPEALEACNWELSPGISEAVIKSSTELKPGLLSSPAPKSRFKFRVSPEPGRYVMVYIDENLVASSGAKLSGAVLKILRAPEHGSNLDFLQSGNILPLSRNGMVDLYATNLDKIKWELQRIDEPFLALMAIGRNIFENGSSPVGAFDAISERTAGEIALSSAGEGKAQYVSLNIASHMQNSQDAKTKVGGLAYLKLCGLKGNEETAWANRLIMATDLGLLVKQTANGNLECFTQDLSSGQPAADVEIQILGANGKSLITAHTDKNGHASLPSLSGLARESRPVAALARKDGQFSWLPLEDPARKVDFSAFKTDGISRFANGLNAFIFSQRGIYRPGEKLNFGIIIKNPDFSPLADSLPLWAEIVDPRGVKVHSAKLLIEKPGLAELVWQSSENAPGGTYILNIRTGKGGQILNSENVRMEEFLPDTLRLHTQLPACKGWIIPAEKSQDLLFRLQNLYGSPASGHKVDLSLTGSRASFKFREYDDFIFTDPLPLAAGSFQKRFPTLLTDNQGEARFTLPHDIAVQNSAKITLTVEGFDSGGGRAIVRNTEFILSPAKRLLGYRPRGASTNLQFIPENSEALLELVAIDNELSPVAWENLNFTISRKEYATSLVADATGLYRYEETPIVKALRSWSENLPKTGLTFPLPAVTPGEYLLEIRHEGQTVCEISYTVAGDKLRAPGERPEFAKLRIKTDKKEYKGGEKARVLLALPYDGTGLISLERDGLESFTLFEAKAGESVQTLDIPESFEGKGYIVVSYARSGSSPAIYMSPHAAACLPVKVNMDKRKMGLKLRAPAHVEPGSILELTVSSDQAGKAIVYAVDEGIHLLTNYHMPQPLDELLGNRALNVSTIQAYDLLMPAMGNFKNSPFGGGTDGSYLSGKFNNPFKRKTEPPLLGWSGLIDIGPEERSIKIDVPAWYSGNARVYSVAVSDNGAEAAGASTAVSSPLVISPSLPLALTPGDKFEAAYDLENTTSEDQFIKLDWSAGDKIRIVDPLPETLRLPANSHATIFWSGIAAGSPGNTCLSLRANFGEKSVARQSCIAVRAPGPFRTTFQTGRASQEQIVGSGRDLYENGAVFTSLVSPLPLPLIRAFTDYLEVFPHGCTEQLVSRAFALLAAKNWLNDDAKLQKQLGIALSAIRSRSTASGVSLWPGSEPDLLLSIYVADFLLAVRSASCAFVDDLLEQLCSNIESQAVLNSDSLADARTVAYGIWVLTREGRITTQLIENLLHALDERQIQGWQTDLLAAFVAGSQKAMHMRRTLSIGKLEYSNDGWFDEFAQKALHNAILARHFPEQYSEELKNSFYEACQEALNKGLFATFSASQGVRTLLEGLDSDVAQLLSSRVECLDQKGGESSLTARGSALEFKIPVCARMRIEPAESAPLFWQMTVSGFDREPSSNAEEHGLDLKRVYLDEHGGIKTSFRQGEEITVQIEASSHMGRISDCAIIDLLPAGFELITNKAAAEQEQEKISFVNRLEDRLLIYANLDNDVLKFSYKARAVHKGRFLAPASRAEAMYDPSLYAQTEGEYIEIR